MQKVYLTPSPIVVGLHNLQFMKQSISFLDLFKTGQIIPKAVLKNHSKSQKNHKIENPIVLDSKWVDLHSEYIIWYALVYFFCCSFRYMFFFIAVKKCTKAYHIICSKRRSTHLESNTIEFSILWFFYNLLWFCKYSEEINK